jgi:hypothetical protein
MDGVNPIAEYIRAHPCKGPFRSAPYYSEQGDFLIYYFSSRECYGERIDELLTVYLDFENKQMVGFKLKGVRVLLNALGDFDAEVWNKNGRTSLSLFPKAARSLASERDGDDWYALLEERTSKIMVSRSELQIAD